MSKYIKLVMHSTRVGAGGAFNGTASFKLDNIIKPFELVPVKIDTGCSISTMPISKFISAESFVRQLKDEDLKNGVEYLISYGVESGGQRHEVPRTYYEKMECTALKFKHAVSNFEICGVPISTEHLYINYNRKGNILIGMDILKDWDIHIGTIDTGETIFLGCPKDQINDEYLQELEDTFHIASDINASIVRQKLYQQSKNVTD